MFFVNQTTERNLHVEVVFTIGKHLVKKRDKNIIALGVESFVMLSKAEVDSIQNFNLKHVTSKESAFDQVCTKGKPVCQKTVIAGISTDRKA